METQPTTSAQSAADLDPPFNFDLDKMKAALEGHTISLPRGLTGEQRREFIRKRLEEIDSLGLEAR